MKSLQIGVPLLFICAGIAWLAHGAITTAHPGGSIDITNGLPKPITVASGSSVTDTFRLVNHSFRPVEVVSEASCGCTVISDPRIWIAPMGTQRIVASVDTSLMRPGKYAKNVRFRLYSGKLTWNRSLHILFAVQANSRVIPAKEASRS